MIGGDCRGEEVDEGRECEEEWHEQYPFLRSQENERSYETGDEDREYSIEREDGWEREEGGDGIG